MKKHLGKKILFRNTSRHIYILVYDAPFIPSAFLYHTVVTRETMSVNTGGNNLFSNYGNPKFDSHVEII